MSRTQSSHYLTAFFRVVLLVCFLIGPCLAQDASNKRGFQPDVSGLYEPYETGKCADNPDTSYSRQKTLGQFAEILNISVFGTKKDDFVFDVKDERPERFTVYDLSEPPNKGIPLGKCINFLNNHVYHFSPMQRRYSFSHIAILENGNLKVFKSINCKGRGDKLEDVIGYLREKLKEDKIKRRFLSE